MCGISCSGCGAYLAYQSNDDNLREKTAKEWSKEYNADIKPENINCNGCVSENGPYFSHCYECEIRECGLEKDVKNCAYCDEYACEQLEKFFEWAPTAKETLDKIRAAR